MNHSMLTCGRTTHLKIVAVALIAAVLFAAVGLKERLDFDKLATPPFLVHGPEAGLPLTKHPR